MKNVISIILVFLISYSTCGIVQGQTKEEKRAIRKASREVLKSIVALYEKEQYNDITPLVDSLLKIDPNNSDGYFYKGLVLAKSSDTSGALATLEEGIVKSPLSSRLKITAARLYIQKNDLEKASKHLDDVLRYKPHEAETLYLEGLVQLQKADTVKALDFFENALKNSLSDK